MIRKVLETYRSILYFFFKKNTKAVMEVGKPCHISEFEFEINKGDIVHPCIRYTERAFKGHNWWLIYTPYYNANSDVENPILCYGISDANETPIKWKVYSQIVGKPKSGYNSDPTMFFMNDKLYVFWRENSTPRTINDNIERATYGCIISEKDRFEIKYPILCEENAFTDKEVSPTLLKVKDSYIGYAMHLRFSNPKFRFRNKIVNSTLKKILWLMGILEIYNDKKCYGISIWKSNSINQTFKYIKTTKIKNCNSLYRPWHMDIFEYNNKFYAVIQTNQTNADICLAVSEDYETFTMYSTPLITNKSIDKIGIYKPTAFVYDDYFYLYYTAQDVDNRSLNKMYRTSINFQELINKL
jgi:hypothetical protein